MTTTTRLSRVIAAPLLLAAMAATSAAAQDPYDGGPHNATLAEPLDTYGTSSYTNYTVAAGAFNPRSGDSTLYTSAAFLRNRTGGDQYLLAAVQIPNGALVLGTEVEGCDDSAVAAEDLATWLVICPTPATSNCTIFAGGTTLGAPGCGETFGAFAPAVAIDNQANTYFIQTRLPAASALNRFRAVRVRYQLRVSPAPATATFTDVPLGHPQRQFVEALVAAGITGGCGGTTYCPDSPLTRGQMAVFLAVALGLHFPH